MNNLEILKRYKIQIKRILDIDENLIINEYKKENYKSSIEKIIYLLINNNIFIIFFKSSENEWGVIYELNKNINYDYFNVPVSIIQKNDTKSITLVFRIRNLYFLGFIVNVATQGGYKESIYNYYHFTRKEQNDLISYPNISYENKYDSEFIVHYNNIMRQINQSIYLQTIIILFFKISNMDTRFESKRPIIQTTLRLIFLITFESLRFKTIYNLIINKIINNYSDAHIYWNPEENSSQTNIRSNVTNQQIISNNIHKVITFDFGKINPIDYFNKVEFLYYVFSDCWDFIVKLGIWIYNGDLNNKLTNKKNDISYFMKNKDQINNKFNNIIKTEQIDPNFPSNKIEWRYIPLIFQDIYNYGFSEKFYAKQKIGLNCYFKNEHWYLQIIFFQYTDWKTSYAPLNTHMKIVNDIILYND